MVENERFAPRRELGRTGFFATALGVGDLADRAVPVETCVATARRALDTGLNVIDTAPNYEDGYSEEIVGRAVRERSRDSVFVIDKIDHHDRPVGPQIEGSPARLGLGHTDLFVFHGLSAMDAFDRLRSSGSGFGKLNNWTRPVPSGNLRSSVKERRISRYTSEITPDSTPPCRILHPSPVPQL